MHDSKPESATVTEAAHLFAGAPDERQVTAADFKPTRFRPRYRALSVQEKELHDELKGKAEELADLFERVKLGRYRSLAITYLEIAVMLAVKELTS